MPIYEFYSPDTHKVYSFFARSLAQRDAIPRCPDGPAFTMQRKLSSFAVTGRAKEKPDSPDSEALDDPRMEAAMAEMEREMASMDEDNPDPRRMGALMRKMAAMTGEKLPPAMEEMVGRLEAGEDPEALEEQFGDMPELDEFGAEGDADGAEGEGPASSLSALRRRLANRQPQRDPQLYELADFID